MPSALKKQLAKELQEGFVIKRSVFNSCLELWPMSEWEVMMAKLNGLNRFVKKNVEFIRRFTAGVKLIEADASGRLLIPKDLISFASISKDIVLTSGGNIIEIWDLVAYEVAVSDNDGDFAALAEDVMGGQNDVINELS